MTEKNTCGRPWLVYWGSITDPKILGLSLVVVVFNWPKQKQKLYPYIRAATASNKKSPLYFQYFRDHKETDHQKVVCVYQRIRMSNGSKNIIIVKKMINNFIIHCCLLSIISLLYLPNFNQLILNYMHACTTKFCRYLICLMSSIMGLSNLKNLFGL